MALPPGGADHYPYEKLTDEQTANISRMRDEQMRKLRQENQLLIEALHVANRQLAAVKAAGIDPDALIKSQEVFGE